MCAEDRNVEHLARQDIGGSGAAGDDSRTGSINTRIRALGAAEAEFHDAVTLGCIAYACRLCSDQGLMIQHVEDSRLNELSLLDRRNDLEHWLTREDNGSFRDSPDITCEVEARKIIQEVFIKYIEALQVLNIIIGKMQVLDVVDYIRKSAAYRVTSITWIFPVECIEYDDLICRVLEIALHHGQLVQVSK